MTIARIALFACFTILMLRMEAQQWKLLQTIPLEALRVELDQLNNLYVIQPGEIIKYNKAGVELSRYSNKLIGEAIHLDVSNPMKVVLYAPDQMKVITLDSRLGEISDPINLFQKGFEQITLVGNSFNNHLWMYDPIQWRLLRLGPQLEQERVSLNLAQITKVDLYPTSLMEVNNRLYLSDPENGVYVFDVLANYVKRVPIKGIKKLVLTESHMFYALDGQLKALRLLDSEEQAVEMDLSKAVDFSVSLSRIALATKKGVNIYQAVP